MALTDAGYLPLWSLEKMTLDLPPLVSTISNAPLVDITPATWDPSQKRPAATYAMVEKDFGTSPA